MTPLAQILKIKIEAEGPIGVDAFMALALGHREHGYYMKKDPFGADGDFTTAPEISQMFGEMIGAWAADVWMQMGKPGAFIFLECGPGRGTLMADMMRATKNVPGFHEAAHIHLMEMSPVLREKQREVLSEFKIQWIERLDDIISSAPLIIIANEFLDALPVSQIQKSDQGWEKRLVNYSEDTGFYFSMQRCHPERSAKHAAEGSGSQIPPLRYAPVGMTVKEGEVFEFSPAREEFTKMLAGILQKVGGAALLIDYGHGRSAPGDTLQALYKHKPVSVFDHIGDADITSHVDFEAIGKAADGVTVHGPVTQGAFLKSLGIEVRAHQLRQSTGRVDEIEKALHRLTHSDQMGELFKVMSLSYGPTLNPAGF